MPPVRQLLAILYVEDMTRARAFYDVFGWPKTVNLPPYTEYELNPCARLGLMLRANTSAFLGPDALLAEPASIKAEIYLTVDDLEPAIAKIEAAGAPCTSPLARRDWGDEAAYYLDPDGHVVVLARRAG